MSHSKKKTYKGWAIVSKRGVIDPANIWKTKREAEFFGKEEESESVKRVTITIED